MPRIRSYRSSMSKTMNGSTELKSSNFTFKGMVTLRVDTMEPVAKRTDILVLLLEASKALAYNALFLATLAFVAKLNDAPESIRTVIGSGHPFTLAVMTTRLTRAAATERHRSVVPGTCSFEEVDEGRTFLEEERTTPVGVVHTREHPFSLKRTLANSDPITIGDNATQQQRNQHLLETAFLQEQELYLRDLFNQTLPYGYVTQLWVPLASQPVPQFWRQLEAGFGQSNAMGMVELIAEFERTLAMNFSSICELLQRLRAVRNRLNPQGQKTLHVHLLPSQLMIRKVLALIPSHLWGPSVTFTPEEFTLEKKIKSIFGNKSRAEIQSMGKAASSVPVNHAASTTVRGTWRLVPLPPGRKALPCHWVLVVKYHANGFVERFKARLVAQGNHQEFGVGCDEGYAPVARFESLRLVLAVGTILDCLIHQMDVHTAFLNGTVEGSQRIYMRQPPGHHAKGKEGYVYKLLKCIYGLEQASRIWYGVRHKFFTSMGFARCTKEYCIYVQKVGVEWIIIVVYVDDLTIMSQILKLINNIKRKLSMRYRMKGLRRHPLHPTVEMDVRRNRENKTMSISQHQYILDLLKKYKFEKSSAVSTPQLSDRELEPETNMSAVEIAAQNFDYRGLVGSLQYLVRGTRPDIANAVRELSKYLSCYHKTHREAARRTKILERDVDVRSTS
ncbi:unnamed protein product [Phytophthora fragariaefolia]|uniref:Unnamed protein product n=1 Tax=Phytophthora fragariaefolia TaxID=1490495 RepID=A0A9W7CNK6_9STRA|nr:unnamed protein product [Phytophthora fragariaefolia]